MQYDANVGCLLRRIELEQGGTGRTQHSPQPLEHLAGTRFAFHDLMKVMSHLRNVTTLQKPRERSQLLMGGRCHRNPFKEVPMQSQHCQNPVTLTGPSMILLTPGEWVVTGCSRAFLYHYGKLSNSPRKHPAIFRLKLEPPFLCPP